MCAASCRSHTQLIEVERVRTDTTYIVHNQFDSIYLHDSIHVLEKNDTVFIEKWHTKYKEKFLTDTLYFVKIDSVPIPYRVEVEKLVEKPLSTWQKIRIILGNMVLLTIASIIVFFIIKFVIKKYIG